MSKYITISRPDDWHVHFRDNELLNHTVPATANHFARALIMPNLKPPLTSLSMLVDYHQRITAQIPSGRTFTPFLTFYLNESVNPTDLESVRNHPFILGCKLYPAGATTNSEYGAHSLKAIYPLLEIMQDNNLVLQVHGEVTHGDIFAREALFIEEALKPLIKSFPRLRIVLEHISTETAVNFVENSSEKVAATITAHHLLYNRNHLLAGGLKPHFYCLPLLKHEKHQQALVKAALSGNPKFFAGTDSAPHAIKNKISECGCAGIYSAPYALALYAQIFSDAESLDKLNSFMSVYGAEFYHQPLNQDEIVLVQTAQQVPEYLPLGLETVVPIAAGETLSWSVHEN